ncbi:uncharacterized protein A1O5_10626 [Cladophialophora psammophila CBS 110553]|uniref:FAD/NAD(P)-binding domain-containing protein n=1 Tax=Cladophialophora psammophila CBS 110553 TaxID=1182543 RepID=W9X7P6_9EURO|nr:uncharacterized protein A1O5_10626 [Cladophialophora psammophila CBS 110553]EXJ66474.1 hypothetical protein A1O5_10626 [Cladophialophora psammophila CBS 110553]
MDKAEPKVQRIFCVIVGAGLTGVSLGYQILRTHTLRHEEFRIFDRNQDFGGVWESNRYPGAACDIPSHAYQMRLYLNANWTKKLADGKEIQQYYANMADCQGLRQCTIFGVEVHYAKWCESLSLWEILIEERKTGKRTKWLANVLFDNGGGFHRPKYANIPGRDSFKGVQVHTAKWPDDIDLRGKRVALVGTGPSAAQVGPQIQPIVKQLHVFQRSSGHVLPRNNHVIPSWRRKVFEWCYPLLWVYHVWYCWFFNTTKPMWMEGTKENQTMHEAGIAFLEQEVKDPVVREKLRPRAAFGCKRVLFLDDWYSMFNHANVELITDKPVKLTENAIVTKPTHLTTQTERDKDPDGAYLQKLEELDNSETTREIDVLIWGTGFDMNDSGGHFQIYGINGVNLSKHWGDYPQTYWGVAVTGFPNLFLTLGPNSVNYWSNVTTVAEIQINWHCKMLAHIKHQGALGPYALHPRPDIQDDFNNWLKNNRGNPTFLTAGCATYHVTPSGATPMYNHFRVFTTWWKMRKPAYHEFVESSTSSKVLAYGKVI